MALLSQSQTSLWEVALSKMLKEDREALKAGLNLHFKFDDLKSTIDKVRGNSKLERGRMKLPLGEINVRAHFDKLVLWVQKFIAIGDTIVTYDPGHAALPWAALRFILQMMVNDSTRAAAFIKGLQQVAFYIYDCTVRERLYLVRETSEDRKQLEGHILALYVATLQFMLKARLFFEASAAKRVVSGIYKSADGVLQLLDVAAQHAWQVAIVSGRIDSENQLVTQVSVRNLSESHQKSMAWLQQRLDEDKNTMIDVIRSNHSLIIENLYWQNARLKRIDDAIGHLVGPSKSRQAQTRSLFRSSVCRLMIVKRAVAAFEGGYKDYDRPNIMKWLSVIPYQQHHKQAFSEIQQGTGTWFLQDAVYKNWKDLPESSLLWLHGPPGCGKSKLMSLAIQEALKGSEVSADTRVLFFYCSGTPAEPERVNPEAIIRCLVKQGLAGGPGLESSRVPRYVVQAFKMAERDGFASDGLALDECRTIISKYAIDHATTYIFLDALDECPDEARFKLIETLQEIFGGASSSFVKILVASRDDLPLGTLLDERRILDIQVDGNRNQQDIEHYVQVQLRQLVLQKRMSLLSRPISSRLQETIVDRLSKGAKGMFRWVSVTLEYLCTLKTRRDIEDRLGKLPPGLINSYGDLFRQRTQKLGEEHRRRLDLAFSLLLLPRRPQAHIFRWLLFLEDEEEDSDDTERDTVIDADVSQGNILVSEAVLIEGHDAVTQLCFNFVVFDKNTGVYRFAHSSVQEFLLEHTQGYYSEDVNHGRVAKQCLPILLRMRDCFCDNTRLSSDDKREPQMKLEKQGKLLQARENRDSTQAYYYVRLPPSSERTVREDAVFWIRHNWAYFLLNSKQCRQSAPLKDLETELQELAIKQKFGSLRATVFSQACRFGFKRVVEAWVKAHPQLVLIRELPPIDLTKTGLFMGTALQSACYGGQTETVEFLLNSGAHIHHCSEIPTKTNALCTAIRECHEPVVKLLLEKGASPNTDPDSDVNYPMHFMIFFWTTNVMPVLRLLVEHGADIDAEDDNGATAVVRAQQKENFEALAFLLNNGAKTSYTVPKQGVNSMLHLAVCLGTTVDKSLAMIQILLSYGADVNFRGVNGETPLHWAFQNRLPGNSRSEIVELLLDNGASVNVQDQRGITPLSASIHLSKARPEHRTKPGFVSISESNAGNMASHIKPFSAATVRDLESGRIARILCASGADASIPDADGWTALYVAAFKGRADIVDLLMKSNAQVNVTTANGETALMAAAERGYVDVAEVLIASGADPNIVTNWGSSPLAYAADNGNIDVTKVLLPITTDIRSQDGDGDTALSNAAYRGYEVVVSVLLDAGAEIVPLAPGPHCPFLNEREKLPGYGRDAILAAWQSGQPDVARMILEHAAAREPENQYAKVLKLWKADDRAAVRSWMNERIANAPENRPEVVALRESALIEEFRQMTAIFH